MGQKAMVERTSDREFAVSRVVAGPPRLVYEAWTRPELFRRWWVPQGAPMTLTTCELDVRAGGRYRLVFVMGGQEMAVFGSYLEVVPESRLVWTNEEGGEAATAITTVTFDACEGGTLVVFREVHPTKEALDEALRGGSASGTSVSLDQLAEFVAAAR